RRSFSIIAIMAGSPSAFAEDLQNVRVGQSILPRVDDAAQVNVGAKVTQRPLGLVWRRRASRSTELYGVVNLRDDDVVVFAPHRPRLTRFVGQSSRTSPTRARRVARVE